MPKKDKKKKSDRTEVREWIVAIIALYGAAMSTYIVIEDYLNNQPILYTAIQIIGKEERPKDETVPNHLKTRVVVTNTGGASIELESALNVYVINKKTGKQQNLNANLVDDDKPKAITTKTPFLLNPDETVTFDTPFYQYDHWFSYHNQYIIHLFSRETDFISTTASPNHEQAEKNTEMFNTMDGILKNHFENLVLPRSEAKPFDKIDWQNKAIRQNNET